ncbi:MAG: hypothetical protein HFG71_12810 [Hungatella sp.]|jgi:hypothetical protein|nr:hypothetical protein [Hungatella sp.]
MSPADSYEKQKRRTTWGIVSSALVLGLSLSIALAGWFFFLDAWGQALRAQQREVWFDPWEDGGKIQNSYKCWNMTGLSEEFAVDFKETCHYCFAFGQTGVPMIVKMEGSLEGFQPYRDALYVEGAQMPESFLLRGVAAPIEDDIREFAIESLNILYDDEVVSEDDFEDLIGVSFLDTTKKPMGGADFAMGTGCGLFGLVFSGIGIFLLIVNIKRRKNIGLLQEREKEAMRQAAMWQNTGYDRAHDASSYGTDYGRTYDSSVWGDERRRDGQPAKGASAGAGVRLEPVKKSNVFLGILGAIGGSLLGVGLWLLISFVGFIAGFVGFVMLKCALKGYEVLSGRLDKKGAVMSLIITAFMIFFANGLEYVIALCRAFFELDASFDTIWYVVMNFGELMTETQSWGGFYMNLVLGYGLSIWASYRVIWSILNYKEQEPFF